MFHDRTDDSQRAVMSHAAVTRLLQHRLLCQCCNASGAKSALVQLAGHCFDVLHFESDCKGRDTLQLVSLALAAVMCLWRVVLYKQQGCGNTHAHKTCLKELCTCWCIHLNSVCSLPLRCFSNSSCTAITRAAVHDQFFILLQLSRGACRWRVPAQYVKSNAAGTNEVATVQHCARTQTAVCDVSVAC